VLTAPRIAALCALALAACADEDDRCSGSFVGLRDPTLLACAWRAESTPTCPLPSLPPWPRCDDPCESITDLATCAATARCRIAWAGCGVPDDGDPLGGYLGCYGVTAIAPPAAACDALATAEECAARDDCIALYDRGSTCPGGEPLISQPDGESCHYRYVGCFDERVPPC
jgi:hypothetical protein